jgi:hypothetical protein
MSTISERATAMAATKKKQPETPEQVQEELVLEPEIPMAIHSPEATSVVYGHANMSNRDVELLALCLNQQHWADSGEGVVRIENHGVRVVRFMSDGRPCSKDGKPIFAGSVPELGGMLINLEHTFKVAKDDCIEDDNISIWAK